MRGYTDFKPNEGQFDLLSSPFARHVEIITEELQMELIDLQAYNSFERTFAIKPLFG